MRTQLSELTSAHARLEREMELAAAERLEYAELALMASEDL
jgi:hypothetical protein